MYDNIVKMYIFLQIFQRHPVGWTGIFVWPPGLMFGTPDITSVVSYTMCTTFKVSFYQIQRFIFLQIDQYFVHWKNVQTIRAWLMN